MMNRTFIFMIAMLCSLLSFSQKDYSRWLKTVDIGGKSIQILRIPQEELGENVQLRMAVYGAQEELKEQQDAYKKGTMLKFGSRGQVSSNCRTIEREEPGFPIKYYNEEAEALWAWYEAEQKREMEESNARYKARRDSIRIVNLKEGYVWINPDSVWVRSKPDSKSPAIGRIYRLSYVKGYEVEGKDGWVEIEFENHTGYVPEDAIAYEWEDMLLTDAETDELKLGRYYQFVPTPAYKAKLDKEQAAEERAMRAANAAPSRKYYTGPRGGCYYINSRGNKQYVDHSFCR